MLPNMAVNARKRWSDHTLLGGREGAFGRHSDERSGDRALTLGSMTSELF